LYTQTILKIVEMLTTSSNHYAVLCCGYPHGQDNAIAKSGDCPFKLDLELFDKLGFTSEVDFVRKLATSRAVQGFKYCQHIKRIDSYN
jgi:hypothetical protein